MSGVTSLNTKTGVVGLTSGNPLIGVGSSGNNVVVTATNTGITSLGVPTQTPLTTGAINLVGGAGMTLTSDDIANSITVNASGVLVGQTGSAVAGPIINSPTPIPNGSTLPIYTFASPYTDGVWYGGSSVVFGGQIQLTFGQVLPSGPNLQWVGVQLLGASLGSSTTSSLAYMFPTPVTVANPLPAGVLTVQSPPIYATASTPVGSAGSQTDKQYTIVAMFANAASVSPIGGVTFAPVINTGALNSVVFTSPAKPL